MEMKKVCLFSPVKFDEIIKSRNFITILIHILHIGFSSSKAREKKYLPSLKSIFPFTSMVMSNKEKYAETGLCLFAEEVMTSHQQRRSQGSH